MVDKVKDLLYKLYNFYSSIHSPNVQEQSGTERTKLESDASDPYVIVYSWYERFLQVEQSVGCSNEVEKYLAENCDGRKDVNIEILEWWKDNCSWYQVLSKVAKDVLVVPVSTVAFELAFSTRGCIVDPFRSSLSPFMVQNLVCSQNWFQATVPISHRQLRDDIEALEEELLDLGNMFKFWNLLSINFIKCLMYSSKILSIVFISYSFLVLNQQPTTSATTNTSLSKGSTLGKQPLISIDDQSLTWYDFSFSLLLL